MDSVPTYDDRQLAVAYAVEALKTGRGTAGTVVANMSPAHSACNTARGNVPLAEWHTRNGLPDGIV